MKTQAKTQSGANIFLSSLTLNVFQRYQLVASRLGTQMLRRSYFFARRMTSLSINYTIYFFRRIVLLQTDQWARRLSDDSYLQLVEDRALLLSPRFQSLKPRNQRPVFHSSGSLTTDNIHVHGLWIGSELSNIELLTIKSFIKNRHIFHLWTYGAMKTELPEGTVIENANLIIPEAKVFRYKSANKYGHGKGSVSGFSDIFRYKLLYERGGWWTDMDVTCLKPLNAIEPYFFRKHQDLALVGNVMKTPPGSPVMLACYEEASREVDETNTNWHKPIEILNKHVLAASLDKYICAEVSNLDNWSEIVRYILHNDPIPPEYRFLHWMNEEWRSREMDKNDLRIQSLLGQTMIQYGLMVSADSKWKQILNDFKHLVWKRIYYYS